MFRLKKYFFHVPLNATVENDECAEGQTHSKCDLKRRFNEHDFTNNLAANPNPIFMSGDMLCPLVKLLK